MRLVAQGRLAAPSLSRKCGLHAVDAVRCRLHQLSHAHAQRPRRACLHVIKHAERKRNRVINVTIRQRQRRSFTRQTLVDPRKAPKRTGSYLNNRRIARRPRREWSAEAAIAYKLMSRDTHDHVSADDRPRIRQFASTNDANPVTGQQGARPGNEMMSANEE
jgi:hypothetical protein